MKADESQKSEQVGAEVAHWQGLPPSAQEWLISQEVHTQVSCSLSHHQITWLLEEWCPQGQNVLVLLMWMSRLLKINKFSSGLFSSRVLHWQCWFKHPITFGLQKLNFWAYTAKDQTPGVDGDSSSKVNVLWWWGGLCMASAQPPLGQWGLPMGSLSHLNKTPVLEQREGYSIAATESQVLSSSQGSSKLCFWAGLMAFPNTAGEEGGKFFPTLAWKSNWGKFCCLDNGILNCSAKARISKKSSLIYRTKERNKSPRICSNA